MELTIPPGGLLVALQITADVSAGLPHMPESMGTKPAGTARPIHVGEGL